MKILQRHDTCVALIQYFTVEMNAGTQLLGNLAAYAYS